MTREEILKEFNNTIEPEDWVNLYKKVFKEDIPITSATWGEFPIDAIQDAILENKPISKQNIDGLTL
tara:strand:- start:358 stop:558 length:201 start_codon:yes stop_codon:yes gene_type:complete